MKGYSIKVSIVIPCYNNGHLLLKMIDCILRQTFTEWELIIVDDGSTDNTQNIVKEYANRDARIKPFIREIEPKGANTCRNIGMNNARGKYIVIFDADDLISDTCLEKRVAFMDTNQDIDYASFPAIRFTEEKNLPVYAENDKILIGAGNNNTDLLLRLLRPNYPFTVWSNIYKTKSLSNIRWDEKVMVYQDFDFMVSCISRGLRHKFSELKEIDYYWRVGQVNNISNNLISNQKCESTIKLFSKILDILKLHSDYKKRKKTFIGFILLQFERIIESGNRKNTADYIKFCENYYEKYFVSKLKIISKITLYINDSVLRKLMLYFLIAVLFCRRNSAKMFIDTLKN